jgi:Protein of unknown function (DUF3150).
MKALSEMALLANLTISQWTARKYDISITRKIERDHNTHNAGRFNKILVAENALQEITKKASQARAFLRTNTLPWGDTGDRILPSTNYFEVVAQLKTYKGEFDAAVNNFVRQYPTLKEDARRRLNGMFQEADYPTLTTIQSKFNFEVTFLPIPDTEDFRLKLNSEEVNKLKVKIESEINTRFSQATKDIWLRIKEAVEHMVERLSEEKAIFRDSLITNIEEMIKILPRLNFTGDKDISATIESMKTLIVHPDTLRKSPVIRNKKAQEAKAILDKISDFLG